MKHKLIVDFNEVCKWIRFSSKSNAKKNITNKIN
jgi:hypothetical protein